MSRHTWYLKGLGLIAALLLAGCGLAWAADPALISGGQFGGVTVRQDRPRVWMTAERLQAVKAKALARDERFVRLKAACDQWLDSPVTPYGGYEMNFGLCYLATGDERYGRKAIRLALDVVAKGLPALTATGRHGYEVRDVLPRVACVYDWCHGLMTADERERMRAQLEQWSDWVWPETNPDRKDAWSIDNPGDNFWTGYQMTWFAGIALAGDSPKAQGYVNAARARFGDKLLPFIAKSQLGGWSQEGTSYGQETLFRQMWQMDAHQCATGEDLFALPVAKEWAPNAIRSLIHLTTPSLDRVAPLGDQAREKEARIVDYTRAPALCALSHLPAPLAGEAKDWLAKVKPNRQAWSWNLWQEVLFAADSVAATDFTRTTPLFVFDKAGGWVQCRTGWDQQATQLHVICGPGGQTHQDRAQGSFALWREGWLVAPARLYGGYGILRTAQHHSTLLVSPHDQPEFDSRLTASQEAPRIEAFENNDRYTYVRCRAESAYDYWQWPAAVKPLDFWQRELLWLKPDLLLVLDRVTTARDEQPVIAALQAPTKPTREGNSAWWEQGLVRLTATPLLDTETSVTPIKEGPGGSISSWRMDYQDRRTGRERMLLQAIEMGAAGSPGEALKAYREPGVLGTVYRDTVAGFYVPGGGGAPTGERVIVGERQ